MGGNKPHGSRCGAKAKGTGKPCQRYAMGNGRCPMHGGVVGSGHGAPAGNQNATTHGLYSKLVGSVLLEEAELLRAVPVAERRQLAAALHEVRTLRALGDDKAPLNILTPAVKQVYEHLDAEAAGQDDEAARGAGGGMTIVPADSATWKDEATHGRA